ncbi:MAG: carbon-nitrogen hydrolase family protein [Planctomycetota bacterium]|jgi:predicted amidohydrolase/predicted small lipoprotein YifL
MKMRGSELIKQYLLLVLLAALAGCGKRDRPADNQSQTDPSQRTTTTRPRESDRPHENLQPKLKSGKTFTAAAIQALSKMGQPPANREHLEKLVREAAGHGAKVIVLPEAAITGYMSSDLTTTWQVDEREVTEGLKGISPERVAESVPGTSTKAFSKLAEEIGVYLTVPIVERDPDTGKYYNTVVLMGPDGRMLLHYRKINPWPWAEKGWASHGNLANVFVDTPLGRMGLLICYDINYEPGDLKKLGVDHLLYPIAWVDEENSKWFSERLPKIARENRLNIIGANWTVPPHSRPDWHGYGHSLIISREGKILAKVDSNTAEQIVYAELTIP